MLCSLPVRFRPPLGRNHKLFFFFLFYYSTVPAAFAPVSSGNLFVFTRFRPICAFAHFEFRPNSRPFLPDSRTKKPPYPAFFVQGLSFRQFCAFAKLVHLCQKPRQKMVDNANRPEIRSDFCAISKIMPLFQSKRFTFSRFGANSPTAAARKISCIPLDFCPHLAYIKDTKAQACCKSTHPKSLS